MERRKYEKGEREMGTDFVFAKKKNIICTPFSGSYWPTNNRRRSFAHCFLFVQNDTMVGIKRTLLSRDTNWYTQNPLKKNNKVKLIVQNASGTQALTLRGFIEPPRSAAQKKKKFYQMNLNLWCLVILEKKKS